MFYYRIGMGDYIFTAGLSTTTLRGCCYIYYDIRL